MNILDNSFNLNLLIDMKKRILKKKGRNKSDKCIQKSISSNALRKL